MNEYAAMHYLNRYSAYRIQADDLVDVGGDCGQAYRQPQL